MRRDDPAEEQLVHSVIGAFFEVYNTLGFGFLEHLYVAALVHELRARGHRVGREVPVRVMYKGIEIGVHRLDLLVDDRLVVETKSTHVLPPMSTRQLYNYLRATGLGTGLVLHFGPEPRFLRVSGPGGGDRAR
jgi:GxxExxY protein